MQLLESFVVIVLVPILQKYAHDTLHEQFQVGPYYISIVHLYGFGLTNAHQTFV
jgi:hypothetical protein